MRLCRSNLIPGYAVDSIRLYLAQEFAGNFNIIFNSPLLCALKHCLWQRHSLKTTEHPTEEANG